MTQPREILKAALKLDPMERAAIASEILDSLEDSAYGPLSPAWEGEIQRRLREVETGLVATANGASPEALTTTLPAQARVYYLPMLDSYGVTWMAYDL